MTRLHLPIINRYAPPKTRGECIVGTPVTGSLEQRRAGQECGALACRHNNRTVRAESVPGRRNNGRDPEWTLDGEADAFSPSCALDVAELGPHRCSEIAAWEGKSKRRIQQEVKAAVMAYRDALVSEGVAQDEIDEVIGAMLAMIERERG